MPKNRNKRLFTFKTKENEINMEVNETNYKHFISLPPFQQKAMQDLMRLKLLQEMYDKI